MADANESEQPIQSDATPRPDAAEREHAHDPDPGREQEHEHEHDPEHQHDEEDGAGPVDPDQSTGFSFEQRRFLWTLSGLNVLAVLLGAAIIVGYQAYARSQDQAIVRLQDAANQAANNFNNSEPRAVLEMERAKLSGDGPLYTRVKQELLENYRDLQEKIYEMRSAQGLEAEPPTDDSLSRYETSIDQQVAGNLARFEASTRPASEPATNPTSPPTTNPTTPATRMR